MTKPILPNSTLGVLGSGQLGRMFTIAARRLGYRVHVLSADYDTPTGQVADLEIRAAYDDLDAIAEFARGVSVVTFEFENVPAATTAAAEKFAPVRPGGQRPARHAESLAGEVLSAAMRHSRSRRFIAVRSLDDLLAGLAQFGYPAVLKTADWGYDGKGQAKLALRRRCPPPLAAVRHRRSDSGSVRRLRVRNLRGRRPQLRRRVRLLRPDAELASAITFSMSLSTPAGVSESVPRMPSKLPATCFAGWKWSACSAWSSSSHATASCWSTNSPRDRTTAGHLTIDACTTCQFEQQVRAVCGLPLGSPRQHRPAAMANLLGDLWQTGEPNWQRAVVA